MGRKQKRQRTGALVAFAAMTAAAAVVLYTAGPWRANDYDAKTFCPKDGQYPRTAFLIDATDSLGGVQSKALRDLAEDLRGKLARYEWIGVYVLNEDNITVPKPEIALCNPGNEKDANPLYQNPREIRRKFDKQFAAPLRQAIDDLTKAPKQKYSPIIEMIRAVALDSDFDSSQKRRLIIVSDMLQHTDDYTQYRGGADYEEWAQSSYATEFADLSLAGVEVEIWYVKRPLLSGAQTRRHVRFWEDFFAAAGAELGAVKRL